MTIAPIQLAYLPQNDHNALLDWAREHGDWHKQIRDKGFGQGMNMGFPYSVNDLIDLDEWAYYHNDEHITLSENFFTAAPPDLSWWDQSDKTNFENWLMAHALVHDDLRKAVGL